MQRVLTIILLLAGIHTYYLVAQGTRSINTDSRWGVSNPVDEQEMQRIGQQKIFYDRFGNSYYPNELLPPANANSRANDICVAGDLFELRFIDVSRSTNEGFDHPTLGADRRQVLCTVFEDIAVLINEANPGSGEYVKVYIQESGASATGTMGAALGIASSYYLDNAFNSEGIMYNEVWKTINTGINSYKIYPTSTGVSSSNSHGYMKINFSKDLSLAINSPPGIAEYDLYSTALHEALHMLGIASALDDDGTSTIANSNMYFKFDEYLTYNNNQLIGVYTDQSSLCQTVTPADEQVLDNGCGQIYYNGVNIRGLEMYSPITYATGSSLSHFKCFSTTNCDIGYNTPVTGVPATPPFPICMTPCIEKEWIKRRISFEEAAVLCDIGYSLSDTYGADNTNPYTYYNDYPACTPMCIAAGVNDVTDAQGNELVMLSGESINISGILNNDLGDNMHISCVEIVKGGGTISNVTDSGFTYTGEYGYFGHAMISYKPVCGATGIGNHTYVFVKVKALPLPSCTPAQCNLICHGDFEYVIPSHTYLLDLFRREGYPDNSPDLYEYDGNRTKLLYRGTNFLQFPHYGSNAGCGGQVSFPPALQPGNKFMGISGATSNEEAIFFELSRPLTPGKTYDLSVDATANIGATCFGSLVIYLSEDPPCTDSSGFSWNACPNFDPVLVDSVTVTSQTWQKLSINGIAPSAAYKYLIVAGSGLRYSSQTPFYYTYADNFSLIENNQTYLDLSSSASNVTPCRGDQFTITYEACIDSGLAPNNTDILLDIFAPAGITVNTPMPITIPANSLNTVGSCSAQIPVSFTVGTGVDVGAVYTIDADISVGNACLSTDVIRSGFGTDVTIASVDVNLPSVTGCDSAFYNGQWYYDTGAAVTQSAGPNCDTTFVTQITVGHNYYINAPVVVGCDSVEFRGVWYCYDDVVVWQGNGPLCDTTYYADIFVTPTLVVDAPIVTCDSAEVYGTWYYTSQQITKTVPGFYCDTTFVTNLTLGSSYYFDETITSCGAVELNGTWYDSSQTVIETYSGSVPGCDSVITTHLVISTLEATTTISGNVITGPANAQTYQWIDCDNGGQHLVGETDQSIKVRATGSYAVIASVNNCIDTSECVDITVLVGIDEDPLLSNIHLYPNPVSNMLTVELPSTGDTYHFEFYSLLGQRVLQLSLDGTQQVDVSSLLSGMYLYQVSSANGGTKVGKLLVE